MRAVRVIAVRDEPDAVPHDAILVQTGKRRRSLIEWWGGYSSQSLSQTVRPEDVLGWLGWRPLSLVLPKDWEEGYLRSVGGEVEFVRGKPPPRASMKYTREEHEAARQSVERLFRDVAARFPHATVRTDLPGPGGLGIGLELSCSLPGTTHVRALAGADQIDVYLGKDTWLELLPNRRKPGKLLDSVRQVVEAVVAGRFEEKLRELGGKVIASRHIFHRSDRRAVWRSRVRPIFLPGRRRTVRYRPYG